jgi:cytochrome b6-f complex iron-sulfur subunit
MNTQEDADKNGDNRRGFLSRLLMIIGLVSAYGAGAVYVLRFLIPRKQAPRYRQLLVASLDRIPENGAAPFKDLAGRENMLVKTGKGLKAISTICTHLGCKVHWEPNNNRFFCPCHNGVFDVNGNVVSGPPTRPLDSYEVVVDENDNVFVMVKEV